MDYWKAASATVILIVFLFSIKKIWSLLKRCYMTFRDYYVLWNIAFGAHPTRRNMSQPMRLHPYVCNPKLLDNISIQELFTFAKSMVSSDINCETFRTVLISYDLAIIFRERLDGSLRGMCLLGKNKVKYNGRKICTIKLGLALFHNFYQGGPYLYYVIIYHLLKELLYRPRTPVYILTKLFSYKSYLALINTCKDVYPVYNKEMPNLEENLLQSFAKSVCFPGEVYNSKTFVLERKISHIKNHAAIVTCQDLKNPHIRFFTEQNPNWKDGHCMFCIAKVDWTTLLKAIRKAISRAVIGRRQENVAGEKLSYRKNSKDLQRHYDRHLSFEASEAKIKVLDKYTIAGENVVLRHRGSDDIYIPEEEITDEDVQHTESTLTI